MCVKARRPALAVPLAVFPICSRRFFFSRFLIFGVALRGFRQEGKDTIYIRRRSRTPWTRGPWKVWHACCHCFAHGGFNFSKKRIFIFFMFWNLLVGLRCFRQGGAKIRFLYAEELEPLGPADLENFGSLDPRRL